MAENQVNDIPVEIDIPQETAIAMQPQKPLPMMATMWNDTKMMNTAWKMGGMLAKSAIVPQNYRGKVEDCVIAIDIGNRLGISPIVVMQNSQVVQGNFTWKGSACRAFIDGCGKFKDSEYVEVGERGMDDWGIYLQATNTRTGKVVKGATVTIRMAKDEGWMNKNGSKWKTMPEQMLRYRAATFFARSECPEVLMGFQTNDEIEDVKGVATEEHVTYRIEMPNKDS